MSLLPKASLTGRWQFAGMAWRDRKSTRLNSSHRTISYAVFCLKKKKSELQRDHTRARTVVLRQLVAVLALQLLSLRVPACALEHDLAFVKPRHVLPFSPRLPST